MININIYTIPDEFGFWDLAGRNLFFKFPKFSFINTRDESKFVTNHFLIDDIHPEMLLGDVLKSSKKKVYIRVNNEIQVDLIIRNLPLYLLGKGKYVNDAVELFDEVIIGVKENPDLHKKNLLKKLKLDPSLSKFSHVRPLEALD